MDIEELKRLLTEALYKAKHEAKLEEDMNQVADVYLSSLSGKIMVQLCDGKMFQLTVDEVSKMKGGKK